MDGFGIQLVIAGKHLKQSRGVSVPPGYPIVSCKLSLRELKKYKVMSSLQTSLNIFSRNSRASFLSETAAMMDKLILGMLGSSLRE